MTRPQLQSARLGLMLAVGCLLPLSGAPSPATAPTPLATSPTALPPLAPPPQGPIYTIEGTYPLLAKKVPFTIAFKDQQLTIARAKGAGGTALPAQTGWIIFDDGGENLWIYPGQAEMERATFSADGLQILLLHPNSEKWNHAPKPFLDAIKESQDAAKNPAILPPASPPALPPAQHPAPAPAQHPATPAPKKP